MIIGKNGDMIKEISWAARKELRSLQTKNCILNYLETDALDRLYLRR